MKVALFPYIPDAQDDCFRGLLNYVEFQFEKNHKDIDLELRPLKPAEEFYDLDFLKSLLLTNGYDVVEIDTVLLSELAATKSVKPWPKVERAEYPAFAIEAVTLDKAV